MKVARSDTALAWAVSLLSAGAVAYFACFPVMDTDLWWHLSAGRLMVQEHRLIHADPFAADTLGAPWTDVHWLFQILAYLAHRMGGLAALVVAKITLIGVGVALSVRALCSRVPRSLWLPAALAVAGFLFPARHLMLARPTVLTLLLLTLMLLVLQRARRGQARWALLLIPVQILWCNVQGLYLLGPGVVACFAVGDWIASALAARSPARLEAAPPRRTIIVLALMAPLLVLAAAATPYGFSGLRLPLRLFGRITPSSGQVFSMQVAENLAPWLLERSEPGALSAFKWLAALTFLSFLPGIRRGLALTKLLLVTVFFALALMANRNVLLFLWVAGPITVENLATSVQAVAVRWLRRGLIVSAVVGLIAMVSYRAREARGEPSIAALAPFRVPEQAVDRLLSLELPDGPIFCSDRYGGYLTWRLGPKHPPTMDGRLVLRTAQQYAEHLALGEHPEAFEAYRRQHGIRTVLVASAYPDRFLPLVVWLLGHPPWRLLYTDGTQTLFFFDEEARFAKDAVELSKPEVVQAISSELASRYRSQPLIHDQARLHLARLLAEVGATDRAEELLASLPGATAQALRARVAYRAGDEARAEQLALAQLARQPNEIESLCLLAVLARGRGEHYRALGLVERALAVDPFHPLAREILAQIQRDLTPGAPAASAR